MYVSIHSKKAAEVLGGLADNAGKAMLAAADNLAAYKPAEATDTQATIGTNVVYAAAHNFGMPGRGAAPKLPQRQFIGIAQPQVRLINRIADQWLKEVLDGNPA